MRAVVLAIVGLAVGSLAIAATEDNADTEAKNIGPCDCPPHARCCMVNGIPQCLMHDADCEPYTATTESIAPPNTPVSEIQVRSAADMYLPTPTSITSSLAAAKEHRSTSWSTETLTDTTVTWFDGHTVTQGPSITRTTFDEQSQTIVTETLPVTPTGPQPTCDAEGNCVFLPSCAVSFPGFISCHGKGDSTTSTPAVSPSIAAERSTTTATTPRARETSDTKLATITSIAAAMKNRLASRATTSAGEHAKRQVKVASLVSAIESIAAASVARASLLEWMGESGPVKRQEQPIVTPTAEHAKRQVDVAPLVSAIESIAAESAGTASAIQWMRESITVKRQERTTITTVTTATVTAPALVYTTLDSVVSCGPQSQQYNATQSSYTTDAQSLPPMTGAPSAGYTASSGNHSSGIIITNPLMLGWSSTASGWSALNPHINNTSVDNGTYLNISTFVAPQPTLQTQVNTTCAPAEQGTVTSTTVIQPSATTASPTDTGFSGFTPAVTSNIGNHSSGAMAIAEIPGFGNVAGAGAAIAGLCLGVVVLL
ncbi:hypothetical protein B0A55_02250 [Friedmanniomyces simplex]|uniref:CBM1 domain-containing protein n=1 Tax=Friedmanniomyces simplex TaxID=329884 RepID=A0A4U0XN80_9PEZI|nr:hypothetical protein B0A55_02250 [Friedmanniomyces simplex]